MGASGYGITHGMVKAMEGGGIVHGVSHDWIKRMATSGANKRSALGKRSASKKLDSKSLGAKKTKMALKYAAARNAVNRTRK